MRNKLTVICIEYEKVKSLHFCSFLQRGAEILSASPDGDIVLRDVCDLHFPIPKTADLFEMIEHILVENRIAHNVASINLLRKNRTTGKVTCSDYEVVFNS